MVRATETERRFIKFLIEQGRKDLAKLYYMPREKMAWGDCKELITTASKEYFRLEEPCMQEMENMLKKIGTDNLLQDDSFIDKSIYDLTILNMERIFKKQENQKFIPIMQHNGFLEMLFNISMLSNTDIQNLIDSNVQVLTKTGNLQIIGDSNMPIKTIIKNLNHSQLQLLCYCVYLKHKHREKEMIFNIKEYCELRGIKRKSNNVNKIIRDLRILEHIYFSFSARVKGRKHTVSSSQVLKVEEMNTRRNEIRVVLGEWANTLSNRQYSLFSKAFFQYQSSNNDNSLIIRLSLKLNETIRNNLKKGNARQSLNVGKLVDYLGFNENTIKAKGFVAACQEPIDQALDEIGWQEGYLWNYRNGECKTFLDYKNDYIEFQNPIMLEAYKNCKAEKFLI